MTPTPNAPTPTVVYWPTPTPMPTTTGFEAPISIPWTTNEALAERMEQAVSVYQMANAQGGIDMFVTAILLVIVGRSLLSLYKRVKSL